MEESNRSFNLWKMLLVIARRKKFIIGLVLLSTVAAVVIALILPKWYRAKTSILPSQYDQPLGITGSFAQLSLSSAGFELPIMVTPSDVYATILKSETIARAVIEENNLPDHLGIKSVHECRLYLRDKTEIDVTGEGIVEVYFEDRDPETAARVANSYISNLDRLNRRIKASKAGSDKEFIGHRLNTTVALLDSARAKMLAFQKKHKAIDLEQQKEMAISAASELKKRLALVEVSLEVKRKIYSDAHPEVRRLKNEVDQLKRQLTVIEKGSGRDNSYFGLALEDMPQLAVRYAELEADIEIQEKVRDLLTGLYEEARIKEQKDTPTISVLETAYPPKIKYRPKRTIIVCAAFGISLLLAVFIALFADYLENLRRNSPSDFELVNQVRDEITGKTGYTDS